MRLRRERPGTSVSDSFSRAKKKSRSSKLTFVLTWQIVAWYFDLNPCSSSLALLGSSRNDLVVLSCRNMQTFSDIQHVDTFVKPDGTWIYEYSD